MKNFFLLLFLVVSYNACSQSVEKTIVLKDAETQLPIEDATVLITKTKQVFMSNAEGEANFLLKGTSNIQITHTSYITTTIRSATLKEKVTVIFLKNNVNELEDIIITKKHPQKILMDLVENSKKTLTVPARLKVYAREFFKLNGAYSYYNDGLMNFQLFGKASDFDTNILVEQNRSYGLNDEEITAYLLGYNLNDIMENYYNFKYLNPILDPKSKKIYDFSIKSYTANKEYYVMVVTPMDDAKGLLDDYKVIYDPKKKLIIEANTVVSERTFAKEKVKTAIGSKNIYKSNFKTIYKLDSSNYYLVSSKEEIGFEKIDKKATRKIEVRNYFVTTNFSNQNYSYKENEVFKDKTLFNKKDVVLSEYWNISGLTATDEEQEILSRVEDKHL